ncbi:outer membrane protein OmpA-like peptidoglycan-associated protein [Lewinella aquimaris]|uniref:Outer membrane protein OmpA-like peptidoglycan-associated protein n=1 Tax=Neolewinella aquimaris TaxID=1835722 RepID=A0A840EC22_9BACT|nr:OmpA family protein [Neolewinella aquimaris]MBB4080997.1 outer membrane protein OmpA-like peptidoglycan-associated protein [Neolewinella aquimaris]
MSTPLRVLCMAAAWFVFYLATYYGCIRSLAALPVAEETVSARPEKTIDPPPVDTSMVPDTGRVVAGGGAGAEAEVIQLSSTEFKLRFPFNSETETISPEVDAYLAEMARNIARGKGRVRIVGHTDDIGTPADNLNLGRRRAEFVKSLLVSQGVPADRIEVSSRGESQPEATNGTEEGRRRNRRAVITFLPE